MILDQSYSESLELLKLGEPCYILRAKRGDGFQESMQAERFGGFYIPQLNDTCREQIGDAWRGRGFSCLINQDADWSVVIHELAHHLERPPVDGLDAPTDRPERPPADAPTDANLGFELLGQKCSYNAYLQASIILTRQNLEAYPPWFQHELPFIRACVHLYWRLAFTSHPVEFWSLGAGRETYGLSGGTGYIRAFREEVHSHEQLPLREVMGLPMPKAALDLWTRDTATN